jgi:hypothetical protein
MHVSIILPFCGISFNIVLLILFALSLAKTYLYNVAIVYEQPFHEYIGYIGEVYSYLSLAKILLVSIFFGFSDQLH